MQSSPDYIVITHYGSIALLEPNNDAARANLRENAPADAQWHLGALVVEPRYLESLTATLIEEGWLVG